jgi:YVTN family beta-propeller protein
LLAVALSVSKDRDVNVTEDYGNFKPSEGIKAGCSTVNVQTSVGVRTFAIVALLTLILLQAQHRLLIMDLKNRRENKCEWHLPLLGITLLALLMLAGNAGAAPYAYITNNDSSTVSVIDTATNDVTVTVNVGANPVGVAVNPAGTKVYVANSASNTVSVINTTSNTVTATVPVGSAPIGIAVVVNPAGTNAYVANYYSNTVSVIDTASNAVTATVDVGVNPVGVAVNPAGTKVYVANSASNTISVINTTSNTVTDTVPVGSAPIGIAVVINPAGTNAYVTNYYSNTVSVIDTASNAVTATVNVGTNPWGVAVNPAGTKVYVANRGRSTVSVIDTATNTVILSVDVGTNPFAFGQFIGPDIRTPNYIIFPFLTPAPLPTTPPLAPTSTPTQPDVGGGSGSSLISTPLPTTPLPTLTSTPTPALYTPTPTPSATSIATEAATTPTPTTPAPISTPTPSPPSPTPISTPLSPTPTQFDTAKYVEEQLNKLLPGRIFFNPPQEMTVGETERVEVRLTKASIENLSTENLTKGTRGRGESQIENVTNVSSFMKVHLTGDNFDIKALSEEEQFVSSEGFRQWEFDVTPLESGTQKLQLTVAVRILISNIGEEKISYPAFEKLINVKVNPGYFTGKFIENNLQWILTTMIGLSGVIMGWIIKKKRKKERENKLLEAIQKDTHKAELILPERKIEITAGENIFGRGDFESDLAVAELGYITKKEGGKYHFRITKQEGRFYIQDDLSKNGTKLNGKEIKGSGRIELKNGEKITLAGINNFIITFKISGA